MTEHGEHAIHIAVPADLLRALIALAHGGVIYQDEEATIAEAEALLPKETGR